MDFSPAENPAAALRAIGVDPEAADTEGVVLAEIAGRDSVAAALLAAQERGATRVLPTAVHTGTEYGDQLAPSRAVARLRELARGDFDVLPLVHVGSPALWAALCGRFASVLRETFGIHSPCLACHLYMHLCRVPLSWALGNAPVVAGERDTHDGKVKLSQLPGGIDATVRVLAHAGIELVEPLRRLSSETIEAAVGPDWGQGDGQLCCVHSGNYLGLDGKVVYDQVAYARYVRGFLEPAGLAVVDAWRLDPEPDYAALVAAVIEGPEAA